MPMSVSYLDTIGLPMVQPTATVTVKQVASVTQRGVVPKEADARKSTDSSKGAADAKKGEQAKPAASDVASAATSVSIAKSSAPCTAPSTATSTAASTSSSKPLDPAHRKLFESLVDAAAKVSKSGGDSSKDLANLTAAIADLKQAFPNLVIDVSDLKVINTEATEDQLSLERIDFLNKSLVECMAHLAAAGVLSQEAALHAGSPVTEPVTLFLHPPVYTCEQARSFAPGLISAGVTDMKNLFVKDKKKNIYLVSACVDTKVDLKLLGKKLGASGGVGFASNDILLDRMGLVAGSVTPFGLLNDMAEEKQIRFILDAHAEELENPFVAFHPNACNGTLTMRCEVFLHVISNYTGHPVEKMDLE